MVLTESMKSVWALKKKKEELEAQAAKIKEEISKIDAQIKADSDGILAILKESGKEEVLEEGLYANLFVRENVGYVSEDAVVKWLLSNGYSNLVRTSTAQAIDKTPLKKAMKTDEKLAKGIASLTVKTTSQYVVVTDEENHAKMIEHVKENKSSK